MFSVQSVAHDAKSASQRFKKNKKCKKETKVIITNIILVVITYIILVVVTYIILVILTYIILVILTYIIRRW